MGKPRPSHGRMGLSRLKWEVKCDGHRAQVSVAGAW